MRILLYFNLLVGFAACQDQGMQVDNTQHASANQSDYDAMDSDDLSNEDGQSPLEAWSHLSIDPNLIAGINIIYTLEEDLDAGYELTGLKGSKKRPRSQSSVTLEKENSRRSSSMSSGSVSTRSDSFTSMPERDEDAAHRTPQMVLKEMIMKRFGIHVPKDLQQRSTHYDAAARDWVFNFMARDLGAYVELPPRAFEQFRSVWEKSVRNGNERLEVGASISYHDGKIIQYLGDTPDGKALCLVLNRHAILAKEAASVNVLLAKPHPELREVAFRSGLSTNGDVEVGIIAGAAKDLVRSGAMLTKGEKIDFHTPAGNDAKVSVTGTHDNPNGSRVVNITITGKEIKKAIKTWFVVSPMELKGEKPANEQIAEMLVNSSTNTLEAFGFTKGMAKDPEKLTFVRVTF